MATRQLLAPTIAYWRPLTRRIRANPRVVKRKYTKRHVKRLRHRDWPQPDRSPEQAIVI